MSDMGRWAVGEKLYYFEDDWEIFGRNWDDAEAFCLNNGMVLTSITSKEEDDFLAEEADKRGGRYWWWTSGRSYNGVWSWTKADGEETIEFTEWEDAEQPNESGEDCLSFYPGNGNWYSDPCTIKQLFICEASC